MKSKLLRLFSCVTVITILLSGCAGEQRDSNSKVPVLSGSETVQAADDSDINDMSSDTEDSGADNEIASNKTDSLLSDGDESSVLPNSSDSSDTQQTKPLEESNQPTSQPNDNDITEENTVENMILQIGDSSFTATLESNEAVDTFIEMMKDAPIVIQMSDYSGFEKVGSLGTSLPTSNKQTTTQSGDIVLYNGNQIVIFYGSNSWSYTRLGRIDDLSGWEDALGSGDVTVTFSLK